MQHRGNIQTADAVDPFPAQTRVRISEITRFPIPEKDFAKFPTTPAFNDDNVKRESKREKPVYRWDRLEFGA